MLHSLGRGGATVIEAREGVEPSEASLVGPSIWSQAAVGDLEPAMKLLERSIAEDHSDGLMYLKVDARFDNLRSHPRFPEMLRGVHLQP